MVSVSRMSNAAEAERRTASSRYVEGAAAGICGNGGRVGWCGMVWGVSAGGRPAVEVQERRDAGMVGITALSHSGFPAKNYARCRNADPCLDRPLCGGACEAVIGII